MFFEATLNDALFSTKYYTEFPLLSFSGRHMYVTFIFECPPPHPGESVNKHYGLAKNEVDIFTLLRYTLGT